MSETTKTSYKRLSDDFIEMHLLDYYKSSADLIFRKFCTYQNILKKQMSLKRVADKIGLEKLKNDGVSGYTFHRKLLAHLKCRNSEASEYLKNLLVATQC